MKAVRPGFAPVIVCELPSSRRIVRGGPTGSCCQVCHDERGRDGESGSVSSAEQG
jgi:hypothetical protein